MKQEPDNLHYDPDKKCCTEGTLAELFPDFSKLKMNCLNKGRVFSVQIDSCGIGIQRRLVILDQEALKKCSQMPEFNLSWKISMAQLALQERTLRY
jgi:hypothetical protein